MSEEKRGGASARDLLSLMRPWHWGKNLLVFVPLFFSGRFFGGAFGVLLALIGFCAFSLASSGVYALNDCFDAPQDRLHPRKKKRPVASGRVSVGQAKALFAALSACALAVLALPLGFGVDARVVLRAMATLCCYIAMNTAYSAFGLKRMPVLDVTVVALGFVLRILLGSALTGVAVSQWLLLTVLSASYTMSLGKRRNELRHEKGDVRAVLQFYTEAFLGQGMTMFLTMTLVFYSLWSVDAQTAQRFGHNYTVYSVPLVILIAMFYNLHLESEEDGDPMEVILHDKRLLALSAAYVLLMFALRYMKGGAA